jgi:hypothetical protein
MSEFTDHLSKHVTQYNGEKKIVFANPSEVHDLKILPRISNDTDAITYLPLLYNPDIPHQKNRRDQWILIESSSRSFTIISSSDLSLTTLLEIIQYYVQDGKKCYIHQSAFTRTYDTGSYICYWLLCKIRDQREQKISNEKMDKILNSFLISNRQQNQ